MKTILRKIRNLFRKIKKNAIKRTKNIRYETRYKNLLVRYDNLFLENKNLVEQLDCDENLKKIDNLKGQVVRLQNIVANLRRDVKIYDEKLRGVKK